MADEHQKPEPVPYGPDMPAIGDPPAGGTGADVRVAGGTGTWGPPARETGASGPAAGRTGTWGPPARETGAGGPAGSDTGTGEHPFSGPAPAPATVLTGQRPFEGSPHTATGPEPAQPGRDGAVQFAKALRAGWAQGITLIARAVMIVTVIIAVILAVHILFAVFKANPHNSIVEFVNRWAAQFAWRFKSLFTPHSEQVATVANYGIAAIVYLVAGRIVAGIIRRFA